MWNLVEAVVTTNEVEKKGMYDAASFYDRPNVTSKISLTPAWEQGVVDMVMATTLHSAGILWSQYLSQHGKLKSIQTFLAPLKKIPFFSAHGR